MKSDETEMLRLFLSAEWEKLADLFNAGDSPEFFDPSRYAFRAVAHQFLDESGAAAVALRKAMDGGCSRERVFQILAAGCECTLGRLSGLSGDIDGAKAHFKNAHDLVGNYSSDELLSERVSNEFSRVGLTADAASVLKGEITAMTAGDRPSANSEKLKTLESKIDTLRHELSLSIQRGQLYRVAGQDSEAPALSDEEISTAQLGQDLWVLEMTNHKRDGFFVEFGATDGILLSNTYLLEKKYGWSGLLAEPNPSYFEGLKKNRSATVTNACISGTSGESVEFIFAEEYGGMAKHADHDQHGERREAYGAVAENRATLETVSLDDFLEQNQAPEEIDYISVDTEGSEFEILRAFPFDKWSVRLWTIEHNNTPLREQIFQLMKKNGYSRKTADHDDWYFRDGAAQS